MNQPEYWGETYGSKLKQHLLRPFFFDELEKAGRIGNLIPDLGSGAWPVTRLLGTRPDRKRICVDIAADNVHRRATWWFSFRRAASTPTQKAHSSRSTNPDSNRPSWGILPDQASR
jgi:hypothetical protein